ncbi:hypothetical protein [Yersinia frederiksenii]|uniref:hypothetical protein n=1 Tax=Yersinia frederiksenii TaxID=29484 RepID=UPI000A805D00|nr:hypothetical protein [Yersinia frederiksenii]
MDEPTAKGCERTPLWNPALARNIALRINRLRLAGILTRPLYPPSWSAILLIALNGKTMFLGFDVKSTFEQPSEESRQGNPPWTMD